MLASDSRIASPATETELCPLCGAHESDPFSIAPDRFHGRQELYQLRRCNSCQGVWLTKPPRPEEMDRHYDQAYHRKIRKAGETAAERRWSRHRDAITQQKSSGAILDIGCSSGAFLSTLDAKAWSLHGIEMDSGTGEIARSATGADVFIGDVASAPFSDDSFDVVTCFDILEHVYDPQQFLEKVHGWLKPNGFLYVVLPNIDSWEARLFGSYWYGLELPRHLFHFSPVSLRRLMKAKSFEEVRFLTHASYAERSLGYLHRAGVEMLGFSPAPLSGETPAPSFAWRAIRKLFRITFISPFAWIAAQAGAGPSMEALFVKRPRG